MKSPRPSPPSFRELFPEIPEERLEEAEANFLAYLATTLRFFDSLEADPERRGSLSALTAEESAATMSGKVDSPKNTNQTNS